MKSEEIKCPHCGQVFKVDASSYESIAQQIKDKEYTHDLLVQKQALEKEKDNAIKALEKEKDDAVKIAVLNTKRKMQDAVEKAEREKTALQHDLEMKDVLHEKALTDEIDKWKEKLRESQEETEYYKNFKARRSTKGIGEDLEQYCSNAFNSIRMTAFPNAYFEKDNQVSKASGSKGDFIYRDYQNGQEFISIMFEMKNEAEKTERKHKNEDFFKELDKDRNEKGCEYAVLVSMLEADNDLYNQGIVDVSYRYPKMYVIRPQFFIPLITLLRNAALNSVQYQTALAVEQEKNLDINAFEKELADFKDKFSYNCNLAGKKFQAAIDDIDDTIAQLQKIRENLVGSNRNLELAQAKLDSITTEKLAKNSPSLKEELKTTKKSKKSKDK